MFGVTRQHLWLYHLLFKEAKKEVKQEYLKLRKCFPLHCAWFCPVGRKNIPGKIKHSTLATWSYIGNTRHLEYYLKVYYACRSQKIIKHFKKPSDSKGINISYIFLPGIEFFGRACSIGT